MRKNIEILFIKTINNMKLRDKLIFTFIVVVFIPIMVVGLFLTYELRDNAVKDAIEQSQVNVERVKKRTAEILNVPIYISNNLQFDQRLSELVNTSYKSTYEVVKAYRDYRTFDYFLQYYPEIYNIKFYMDNPTLINNWEFIPVGEEERNLFWFGHSVSEPGFNRWYYLADETKANHYYLSLVKRINFLEQKTHGTLVITIDPRQLKKILQQEPFLTMIVDESNFIISANQPHIVGKGLYEIIDPKHKIKNQPAVINGEINGESSQIIVDNLLPEMSQNQLRIISIVTDKHIVKDANKLSMLGAAVTLIGVIIAVILITSVSWLLSKRLSNLSQNINRLSAGDLSTRIVVDGDDEIGQLSKQFNNMVENIHGLIDQVEETTKQKNALEMSQNEIKLKMMASQINPHFLFNTLESIRMKSHMKGEKEIAKVVKQLGKLMRKSLEVGGSKIPLSSEIEMVRCYLEIQKFRYENRLNYELSIDPLSENMKILPLIIQPLVENAVIHGLEDREDGGMILIKTKVIAEFLTVTVEDNGSGMKEERLNEIIHMLAEHHEGNGNRIGLLNVHNRLQLTYGKQSGLMIDSQEGKGTKIQFNMPRGDENV
ncbi:sensor histidine kinase [Bacillus sp. SA1-12]|uniref:cache domain-containing sensor histidine kinase n=1 Tax=Bacillus sp. SA1-12 TaxID=1455638 RepID=UPI000A07DA62|nr:sensor histidine kinase [Bacillus sp. SA1-12]